MQDKEDGGNDKNNSKCKSQNAKWLITKHQETCPQPNGRRARYPLQSERLRGLNPLEFQRNSRGQTITKIPNKKFLSLRVKNEAISSFKNKQLSLFSIFLLFFKFLVTNKQ